MATKKVKSSEKKPKRLAKGTRMHMRRVKQEARKTTGTTRG